MKNKESKVHTLVIGGGLAGLSTAYHLKNKSYRVIEREKEPGGTARSFKIKGFTFDITGHLLHLRWPETKRLISKLLNNNFYSCLRKAWIFSHKTYTKYPFQANTYGLPTNVVDECVSGFLKTAFVPPKPAKNFQDWCETVFGKGISKHFMIPYNRKLFQIEPKEMNTDWCGPFVPKPKLEDVIRGAIGNQDKKFGYNSRFLYPKKGGIQELAKAFTRRLKSVQLGCSVLKIDIRNKVAYLSTGEKINYRYLVNTIPLPEFLKRCIPLPASIRTNHGRLRFSSILCLNIGVKRSKISDKSWVYFPEKKYPFYRVGFPMNFTPHVVPKGCSSMYVEIPGRFAKSVSQKKLIRLVREGLIEAKILKRSDKLPVIQVLPIKYAYVVYDKHRKKSLDSIFNFFKKNKIQSIGRYGAWKYSFMEEAILDGIKAAKKITA